MKSEYTLFKIENGFVIYKNKTIPYNPKGGTEGSFICLGELKYDDDTKWVTNVGDCNACRELLASSFDIECLQSLNQIDFSALSKEEQKKIGWFDLSKLANEQFDIDTKKIPVPSSLWYNSQEVQYYSFIKGFEKAQELLSNPILTEEDLIKLSLNIEVPNKSWIIEVEMEWVDNGDTQHDEGGTLPGAIESYQRPKITNNKIKITKIL